MLRKLSGKSSTSRGGTCMKICPWIHSLKILNHTNSWYSMFTYCTFFFISNKDSTWSKYIILPKVYNIISTFLETTTCTSTYFPPKCLDDCDFQSGWCGWVNGENGKSDDADWQREAGSSSSAATGPAADHTTQSTAGQRKENHVQFDLGYPATSYVGYLSYSAVILQCILSIFHSFPHQLLLKTKTKWIKICFHSTCTFVNDNLLQIQ